MDLIFRMPCILLTCIYVQPCVCKYIEASEQGCAVVRVCYLYSNVKLDWPVCHTTSVHPLQGVPVGKQFWKWKRALFELQLQSVLKGESSVTSHSGSRSRATVERTRDQHGAHLCSHPCYRQCLKFSGSCLMAIRLAFFNHSTQLGGQAFSG